MLNSFLSEAEKFFCLNHFVHDLICQFFYKIIKITP